MVCAWEMVASLPSVCADEFKPTKPGRLASANRESLDSNTTQSSGASVRTLDLYSCDEHAFCQSCSEGNEYCAAVAWYYGGVGVPLRISYRTEYNYSHGMIGANAAMHALMLDLDFWCKDATLAHIASGTFKERFHGAAGFTAGDKSRQIGGR